MEIIKNKSLVNQQVNSWNLQSKTIGFVPTMGALHEGHLALIEQSVRENDMTICSIFVNPLQFNKKEDLENYPNTLENDLSLLEKAGCSLVFMPDAESFYEGVEQVKYDFGILGEVMEATHRPGHFEGVAAVISELFKCLLPSKAYFGEKDYQQLAIVRWLTKKENFPVQIVACTTVRAKNGLALSSRNLRLSEKGLTIAPKIYEVLQFCKNNKTIFDPETLMEMAFTKLSESFQVEYFEIVDEESFERIDDWADTKKPRAFVVGNLEGVRLIDNLSLIE